MAFYAAPAAVIRPVLRSTAALLPSTTPDRTDRELSVTSSELSPAVLAQTTQPALTLFGGLSGWGLSSPALLAVSTSSGVRVLARRPGETLSVDPASLRRAWTLVWFHDVPGWSFWDSPWLVVWDHRPKSLTLDNNGLHARFTEGAGTVALMPLYGLQKPDSSGWTSLPGGVVRQCNFWAGVLRRYPIAVREDQAIDAARGDILIRDRFRWLSIRDDWRTRPVRLAPISPTLALAWQGKRMPVRFSGPLYDPGLMTPYGPYMGVQDTSTVTIRIAALKYVRETEVERPPDASRPVVAEALHRLRNAMREAFSSLDGLFHQDFGDPPNFSAPPPQQSDGGNTCWALMAVQYECRSLPYLSQAMQAQARARLHRYFADWVLQPERYKPFRGKLLLVGPGIGTWGGYDDAGKFSSNSLITLWTYAYYTGDWALIRERWPLIQKLFITPRESSWRGFGRDTIAEMGDEAAPALAMARLAYRVGDRKTFQYATYIFARELTHHAVKNTGAAYFVARSPFNNPEPMPSNVYLTNLWGDTAGWQIDGPTYPKETGERQYTNRWVRFGDPDVARFHRDEFQDRDRAELNQLLHSGRFTTKRTGSMDDPHILPSMVRLRSLLLDESPETLAAITPVNAPIGSLAGQAAFCEAFLRVSRPVEETGAMGPLDGKIRWERGLEQDRPEDEPILTEMVSIPEKGKPSGPPALTWWGWKPPQRNEQAAGGDRWSFGQITTDRPAGSPEIQRLSWNTVRVVF